MKTADLLKYRLIASTSIIASLLFFASCEEKKAEPIAKTNQSPDGSETGGEEDGETESAESEGDDEAGDSDDFDLCTDGLKKTTKLKAWSALVKQLCDEGKLKDLRKPANVYKGGEPIVGNKSTKEAEETNFLLSSSSQYASTVDDYWSLVRLQTTNPSKYKELEFLYDDNVEMKEVSANATSSSYIYVNNDGDGGHVEYNAKTSYITLKKGQAYIAATEMTKYVERMKALKGLIIVNKLSSSKVEVFTISDQTYEHDVGQSGTVETKVLTSLKKEQKNAFENAKNSEKATTALGD